MSKETDRINYEVGDSIFKVAYFRPWWKFWLPKPFERSVTVAEAENGCIRRVEYNLETR